MVTLAGDSTSTAQTRQYCTGHSGQVVHRVETTCCMRPRDPMVRVRPHSHGGRRSLGRPTAT